MNLHPINHFLSPTLPIPSSMTFSLQPLLSLTDYSSLPLLSLTQSYSSFHWYVFIFIFICTPFSALHLSQLFLSRSFLSHLDLSLPLSQTFSFWVWTQDHHCRTKSIRIKDWSRWNRIESVFFVFPFALFS